MLLCLGQTWKTLEHIQKENWLSLDWSLLSTTVCDTLPSTCKQLQSTELLDLRPASGTPSGIKDSVKRTLIPKLREMTIRTENWSLFLLSLGTFPHVSTVQHLQFVFVTPRNRDPADTKEAVLHEFLLYYSVSQVSINNISHFSSPGLISKDKLQDGCGEL